MPLDDRLREGLEHEVAPITPDTERHLEAIRRHAQAGPGGAGWLVAATVTVVVMAILVLGLVPRDTTTGPGSTPTADASPDSSAAPEPLAGTEWTVTLAPDDDGVPDPAPEGEWILRLGEDSTVQVVAPDSTTHRGVYALTGAAFVTNLFANDFGSMCASPGEYGVTVDGGRLTFSGRDTCLIRRTLLVTRPWTASG